MKQPLDADADRGGAARAAIRTGTLTPEAPLDELPKRKRDVVVSVEVVRLDSGNLLPERNKTDAPVEAAA